MHVFWPRLFHFVNVLEIDESLDPISFVICNARLAKHVHLLVYRFDPLKFFSVRYMTNLLKWSVATVVILDLIVIDYAVVVTAAVDADVAIDHADLYYFVVVVQKICLYIQKQIVY